MGNSTENITPKLEQIKGLELAEKLENPLIYTATITALNTLWKMVNRKEIKKGENVVKIPNFESLVEIAEEKEIKIVKMLALFETKPESCLPESIKQKNVAEITNLVILILQILTKKETPVFVREKVEPKTQKPKITAPEALQEINDKAKIEKQTRKLQEEIKKIEEDFKIADHCFTQTNAILIYLKTVFLPENFHLPGKIEEVELTVKSEFEKVKNLIENLIEKHHDIYDKCDFVVITELIEKIPEDRNSRDLSLFIENLYKSEVFLLNLLTNLKSKIQNLELEETKLKTE